MRVFELLEASLDQREPIERCCCGCCSVRTGLVVAMRVFVLESLFHLAISFMRPLWEWTSTAIAIVAFLLQDACRLLLLVLACATLRALGRSDDVERMLLTLQRLFRGLVVLIVLEVIELLLNASAVHAVCDAPEVWERRAARNGSGLTESQCELVSDIFDFGWGGIALSILCYVALAVHSYARAVKKALPKLPHELGASHEMGAV